MDKNINPNLTMNPFIGDRHFEVLIQLLGVARELEYEVTSKLSYFGLSNGKLKVLLSVLNHERPLNPSELADEIGVTRSTMTGLLDGLEKDGFIRRDILDDRRKTAIYLTEKGSSVLNTLSPLYSNHVTNIFSKTTEEEQQLLVNLLEKIKDGLHEAKKHNIFPT
ncbi:MarR family winged helix-turn-helix transcriptional regulator [Bacillus sp. X1(2014)]|uniref:MarR family winged helix-turn-helix transcriptional regulator n=1 Tax=Bacillus sp. X1(2014) TaxID=1565991 RepID=UPI0011A15540|nr:MarR family transcriptional regulator [Bacillus sp. X1(2014)]